MKLRYFQNSFFIAVAVEIYNDPFLV